MINAKIAVFGAAGHTGRFIVAEIERRGMGVIRIGRDARKLAAGDAPYREPARLAQVDSAASLDAALWGADAVINCAGPFIDTAIPVIDAAIRAGIPYLDVAAEQAIVQSIFRTRGEPAERANVPILPAAAFYGGLADLLATAAADDFKQVDEIAIAVGLDSWHPTAGTLITGRRNTVPRVVQRQGRLESMPTPPPTGRWDYPEPIGSREVMMLPFSEMITIGSHLKADAIESWINVEAVRDIRDPDTPAPRPTDDLGRSSQRFVVDVVVGSGDRRRRATATGRDIYHVSAPIVVEAAQRLLDGNANGLAGVHALGDSFDARAFLSALEPHGVEICHSDHPTPLLRKELIDVDGK